MEDVGRLVVRIALALLSAAMLAVLFVNNVQLVDCPCECEKTSYRK